MPAFEILAEGKKAPIMSKFINCQMNFELKVDLKWKAKFIMGRHMTNLPSSITYSSIIIHDSVRLTFLIAALNDLDIITPSNIRNTYLNAPTMERVHTICGLEFGAHLVGHVAVIQIYLYRIKSSGAAWCFMFLESLFLPRLLIKFTAYPDVWLCPVMKTSGEHYGEYLFVYVED